MSAEGQGPVQQTVVCMRWGTLYDVGYVNKLYRAVMRNTARPTRFVAFCDDEAGLDAGIEPKPIPPITLAPGIKRGPWRKLALWSINLGGLAGPVLFLDLDVVITGPLDPFFDFEPGKLCLIRNWTQAADGVGNSSVMRFVVGSAPHLVTTFEQGGIKLSYEADNEQIFVTRHARLPMAFWPPDWCRSFKHGVLPRWPLRLVRPSPFDPTARIIVFTGDPRPLAASQGRWPARWYKKIYKTLRPVPWIKDHWYLFEDLVSREAFHGVSRFTRIEHGAPKFIGAGRKNVKPRRR